MKYNVSIAKKGIKKFCRAGIDFTETPVTLEIAKVEDLSANQITTKTLERLKAEPMLSVVEIKDKSDKNG